MLLMHFVCPPSTGSVHLRYKLGIITHKYELSHRNLADGYPHYVNITRHNRTIKTQVHADLCFIILTEVMDCELCIKTGNS